MHAILLVGLSMTLHAAAVTTASGPYTDAATWAGGVVPPAGSDVTVAHAVTLGATAPAAASLTLAAGGTLSLSTGGTLAVANSLIVSGGQLVLPAGQVTVGSTGGGNAPLTLTSGALSIAGGTLTVNGTLAFTGGSFTLSSGSLTIDPNSGTAASSVASGSDVFSVTDAVSCSVNGGSITFVDPPLAGVGRSFVYGGTTNAGTAWLGSTMVLGANTGANTVLSSNTVGFNIDTRGSGSSFVRLGNLVANGGSMARQLSGAAVASHGFDIGGDLTVNANSFGRSLTNGAKLRLGGNLTSNGVYYDNAGIVFGQRTGSNTVHQRVTAPAGIHFANDKATPAKWFTSLEFDNIATPTAVSFALGGYGTWVSGSPPDGALGVDTLLDFKNGIIDVGGDNQFVVLQHCAVTRTNGFLLRGKGGYKEGSGKGEWVQLFPAGASRRVFHIGTLNPLASRFDYLPVTFDLSANTYDGKAISIFSWDQVHPQMQLGGAQASYLSRWWNVVSTNALGTYDGTATFTYLPEDVVGSQSQLASSWINRGRASWTVLPSTFDAVGHRFTAVVNPTILTDDGFDLTARAPAGSAGTFNVSAATYTKAEGNSGTSTKSISVTRTGGSMGAVGVAYATSDGTATAGTDYVATSGSLQWADGDTAAKTFAVSITGDTAVEPDETVNLALSAPTGGATLSLDTAVLTITNDDDAPFAGTLAFSTATQSVNEGQSGLNQVAVTVSRTGGSAGAVNVTVSTSDGTATAPDDYLADSQTLSWADGDDADKTFTVSLVADLATENDETVNLTLSAPTGGATLGTAQLLLTIVDDDPAMPPTDVPPSTPQACGCTSGPAGLSLLFACAALAFLKTGARAWQRAQRHPVGHV